MASATNSLLVLSLALMATVLEAYVAQNTGYYQHTPTQHQPPQRAQGPQAHVVRAANAYNIRCPNGFINEEKSCYKFVRMPVSWMEAKVLCETMDAHLVEIDSPVEEQFIMQRIYFVESGLQELPLWLGASDLMNQNEWVWMHSKRRMGYRNWNMNKEGNLLDVSGRCLALQPNNSYAWIQVACHRRLNFVCEREMVF